MSSNNLEHLRNYIDGRWCVPQTEHYLPNYQPATGAIYSYLPGSGAADIDTAVQAARRVLPEWSKTSRSSRAAVLRALATKIREKAAALARAESVDQGKPVSLAQQLDIPRAAYNCDFFASALEQFHELCWYEPDHPLHYSSRLPVGVCGLIIPWNLPLYLLTWKLAPALAMGNTVVVKPSELTPMTAYLLAQLLAELDLPAGVCNIVFGEGAEAGAALVAHPQVPLISFTGSTATGEKIIAASAPHFKKLSLELGGKNPSIVFADAPWEKALELGVRGSFLNQGEICLSTSRIFVEEKIYWRYVDEFVARSQALKVGDPLDPATVVGALVSADHCRKVFSYIEMARQWQGTVRCGGEPPDLPAACAAGYFCPPTVITDVPVDCPLLHEEIFGPVATISPFRDEDEVLQRANASPYGLAASVWTTDVQRAQRVAQRLEVGMVWVNTWMARDLRTPFGGMKASGLGREGGSYSLEFYSETKTICIA